MKKTYKTDVNCLRLYKESLSKEEILINLPFAECDIKNICVQHKICFDEHSISALYTGNSIYYKTQLVLQ